ncbi:hypothetical protein [Chryseobacterium sp. Leaf180]|uniref:hypothetical protein n=1 Tax=Chryseobacterium sp. Leaf180 TaxID=1736289 RepID=UPI00103E73C0|nr:hypothetical protein [Chryseobacterium sp. Leaf180]
MRTNLMLLNPIEQIKTQNLSIQIDTDEKRYFETDLTICEDETLSVDVCLELTLEHDASWNQTAVKKIKAHILNAYDSEECEDVELNDLERRQLARYLAENLNVKIN